MRYTIRTTEKMKGVARALLARAQKAPKTRAFIAGLSGELGAGKTTFAKSLAKELGIRRNVISPTFILERAYTIPKTSRYSRRFARLIHIDAYRLTEHDTLFATYLAYLVRDPKNLIVIEWPERIKIIVPKKTPILSFAHKNERERIVIMPKR